jgi:TRAP-type mannitol/chloroaromatic compound transport system permease small subunit
LRFFLALSEGIDAVTGLFGKLMWWLSLFMVLIGAYNVVTRYAFDQIAQLFGERVARVMSGNRYLELQTYSYDLIFLLAAAYVLSADSHVRVDIIFSQLGSRARAWIDIIGTFLFLFPFCALGIYFSQSYVARSWRQMEISPNPGGLARYPIKTVIIVAFALLVVQGISELIKNIAFLRGHPDSRSIHQFPEERAGEHLTQQTEAL